MGALLRAENLKRVLEGEVPVTLVTDASLEIRERELTVITGPSGSGKSSLLYLLGLIDVPTSGRIWVGGTETTGMSEERLADLRLAKLGFVFQFHFLLPEFTALENVTLPMERAGRRSPSEMNARAEALLSSLGLEGQLRKRPRQLSGGQSQRVAIARALANEPAIILADEPTGNLDSVSSSKVREILRDLAHREGRAVVVVSHDPHFSEIADTEIHIVDGKIESAAKS